MEYGRLTQFVLDYVGGKVENIKDFRFWCEIETREPAVFGLTFNTGKFKMMLCRFSVDALDKTYLLGQGDFDYKARIIPVDEQYKCCSRTTYADDILYEFEKGYILPYEEGDYLKENIKIERPAGGGFTEVFEGDILFNKDNEIRWSSFIDDDTLK